MGLFDTVTVRKLPIDAPEFVKKFPVFQTYDLGRGMGDYEITDIGEIKRVPPSPQIAKLLPGLFQPVLYKRKRIELYATNLKGAGPRPEGYCSFTENGEDCEEIVYIAQFRNGKLSSLKEKYRDKKPALPMSEM